MVDQSGEMMQVIDGYLAKKKEIVCLRSAIRRYRENLNTLANVLDGDPAALDLEQWADRDISLSAIREAVGQLKVAIAERKEYEGMLRQAGYGDIIKDDEPPPERLQPTRRV